MVMHHKATFTILISLEYDNTIAGKTKQSVILDFRFCFSILSFNRSFLDVHWLEFLLICQRLNWMELLPESWEVDDHHESKK